MRMLELFCLLLESFPCFSYLVFVIPPDILCDSPYSIFRSKSAHIRVDGIDRRSAETTHLRTEYLFLCINSSTEVIQLDRNKRLGEARETEQPNDI